MKNYGGSMEYSEAVDLVKEMTPKVSEYVYNLMKSYDRMSECAKDWKDLYLAAVADYECEKSKNKRAIDFLHNEYNTYPSAGEWRKALEEILWND